MSVPIPKNPHVNKYNKPDTILPAYKRCNPANPKKPKMFKANDTVLLLGLILGAILILVLLELLT